MLLSPSILSADFSALLEDIKKIENVDEYNNKLKKEQQQIQNEMTEIAQKISEIRKVYAQNLFCCTGIFGLHIFI